MQLFTGGVIHTMDSRFPSPEAVLVVGGRIAAVGQRNKLMLEGAQIVDLQGGCLLPGFVDSHSHLAAAALQALLPDLSGCQDAKQMLALLGQRAKALSPGAWLIAVGWDESVQGPPPDRAALDEACPGRPVLLLHVSGHAAMASSSTLERLGYGGHQPAAPEGGRVTPEGRIEESALLSPSVQEKIPRPDLSDAPRALRRVCRRYLAAGFTLAQESLASRQLLGLLEAAARQGELPLDVCAWQPVEECDETPQSHSLAPYENHLRRGGAKLFLDGSPQAKTAFLTQPYFPPPEGQPEGYRGRPALSDGALYETLLSCARQGRQAQIHANGDAAIDQLMDVWRQVCQRHPPAQALRPILIHGQCARPDQLPELQALGITPSFFVDHVWRWGEYHARETLGMHRAEGISPLRSAQKAGVRFSLHRDTPVLPPRPLQSVQTAVCRRTSQGRVLGEPERIDTMTALRAVTIDAAWQLFEESLRGSLTPGKKADLLWLQEDPLAARPERIADIAVRRVYVDGTLAYQGDEK